MLLTADANQPKRNVENITVVSSPHSPSAQLATLKRLVYLRDTPPSRPELTPPDKDIL